MEILAQSKTRAAINAPVPAIDITDWLFSLSDAEYQVCSTAHIACGSSLSPEGKRIFINVEKVGDIFLVQHYIEQVSERQHCRVFSITDSIGSNGKTTLGVTWELTLDAIDQNSCELSNHVVIQSTESSLSVLEQMHLVDFSPLKAGMQKNLTAHTMEETQLFANDIERKALSGIWGK